MKHPLQLLKSTLLVVQVVSLICATLMFTYYAYYFYIGWTLGETQTRLFPYFQLYLTLPLIFMGLTSFFIVKSIRSKGIIPVVFKKNPTLNKLFFILYILYAIISILVIGFFAMIVYAVFTDTPPRFFPTDDRQATYVIKYSEDQPKHFYIVYDTISDKNNWRVCDEQSGKKHCYTEPHPHQETVIGKSPVDLMPYLNQNVLVSGDFVYSHQQCIVNKCVDIGGYAVFNIKNIRLK